MHRVYFDTNEGVDAGYGLWLNASVEDLSRIPEGPARGYARHHLHDRRIERRHGFAEAVAEYDRLPEVYPLLGYDLHVLPEVTVVERANWILASLAS
jgi:hypothetical protein